MHAQRKPQRDGGHGSATVAAERPAGATAQRAGFMDNRPAAGRESALQAAADRSPRASQLKTLQRMAGSSAKPVVQMAQVTSAAKYALEDVSTKHLFFGSQWKPSNVMTRGIDFSGGTYASIIVHLLKNGQNSKWVSTSTGRDIPEQYAGGTGFVYHCLGVQSGGLNATEAYANHRTNRDEVADANEVGINKIGATYPFPEQKEISVWNQIAGAEIVGAFTQVAGEWRYYKRGAFLNHAGTLPVEVQGRL